MKAIGLDNLTYMKTWLVASVLVEINLQSGSNPFDPHFDDEWIGTEQ